MGRKASRSRWSRSCSPTGECWTPNDSETRWRDARPSCCCRWRCWFSCSSQLSVHFLGPVALYGWLLCAWVHPMTFVLPRLGLLEPKHPEQQVMPYEHTSTIMLCMSFIYL